MSIRKTWHERLPWVLRVGKNLVWGRRWYRRLRVATYTSDEENQQDDVRKNRRKIHDLHTDTQILQLCRFLVARIRRGYSYHHNPQGVHIQHRYQRSVKIYQLESPHSRSQRSFWARTTRIKQQLGVSKCVVVLCMFAAAPWRFRMYTSHRITSMHSHFPRIMCVNFDLWLTFTFELDLDSFKANQHAEYWFTAKWPLFS